jgi:hypothetical protein
LREGIGESGSMRETVGEARGTVARIDDEMQVLLPGWIEGVMTCETEDTALTLPSSMIAFDIVGRAEAEEVGNARGKFVGTSSETLDFASLGDLRVFSGSGSSSLFLNGNFFLGTTGFRDEGFVTGLTGGNER